MTPEIDMLTLFLLTRGPMTQILEVLENSLLPVSTFLAASVLPEVFPRLLTYFNNSGLICLNLCLPLRAFSVSFAFFLNFCFSYNPVTQSRNVRNNTLIDCYQYASLYRKTEGKFRFNYLFSTCSSCRSTWSHDNNIPRLKHTSSVSKSYFPCIEELR